MTTALTFPGMESQPVVVLPEEVAALQVLQRDAEGTTTPYTSIVTKGGVRLNTTTTVNDVATALGWW